MLAHSVPEHIGLVSGKNRIEALESYLMCQVRSTGKEPPSLHPLAHVNFLCCRYSHRHWTGPFIGACPAAFWPWTVTYRLEGGTNHILPSFHITFPPGLFWGKHFSSENIFWRILLVSATGHILNPWEILYNLGQIWEKQIKDPYSSIQIAFTTAGKHFD